MFIARCAATALAVTALLTGCATHAATPSWSDRADGASTGNVVTAQELSRLVGQGSIMEALQRLRPVMLVSRGVPPWVSVDGAPLAELSLLRSIQASVVREVRLERSSSSTGYAAIAPNGHVIVGDVIVVTTWRGGRGPP